MKKILLILATVTIIATNSNAQETDSRDKLAFGIKVGGNYSNVYDDDGESFTADGKVGVAAGMFFAIPIGKYFGIQPELMFSQKGFQGSGKLLGMPYSFKRTTNYLDVPLLFAFKPSEFITLLAGPQYSYLLKQKDVFSTSFTTVDQEKVFENDNARKNILGVSAGVDITIEHFVIGARASMDMQNNRGDGTSTTPRYKNALFQATIGFRLYND